MKAIYAIFMLVLLAFLLEQTRIIIMNLYEHHRRKGLEEMADLEYRRTHGLPLPPPPFSSLFRAKGIIMYVTMLVLWAMINSTPQAQNKIMRERIDLRDAFMGGAVVHHTGVKEADTVFNRMYAQWHPEQWLVIKHHFPSFPN